MDIDALRSFIAFVDTGSFTRAARQTYRTQSAISMQMKKLEEETGQELFKKEGRNLTLTDSGRELVSYARRIIHLHDEALSHYARNKQHSPLRIGCPDDYAESILADFIQLVSEQLPDLTYQIHCDSSRQLRLMLDAGEIDAAILTRMPDADEGYILKHDKGVWVSLNGATIFNPEPLPLILYEPDCKFHSTAIDGLEKKGIPYRIVASSSSATAIKHLIRQGLGITAMATSSVNADLEIIKNSQLPALPAVDIVLAIAPISHPLFGISVAAQLSSTFFEQNSKAALRNDP